MKNKKRKKIRKSIVIELIVGIIIGFVFAIAGFNIGSEARDASLATKILELVIPVVALCLSYVIHIIVHEAGHLIGGFISGYRFSSFRVFNIIFIKENGRLTTKKYNISGTMGQCLMIPLESHNGSCPFIIYNISGGLANFLLSGVFLVFYVLLIDVFAYTGVIFVPLIGIGVILGAVNLLPLKISGVATDGYNIILLRKNEEARRAFYFLLNVNASAMKGIRYRDMPAEWSELPNNYNNSISVTSALTRFNCLMDNHDFSAAKELAEKILAEATNIIELYKKELRCELLFIEIIGENRSEEIERLYTDDLKKYIKASESQLSKRRLTYAYQKLVAHNEAETEKALGKFNKTCLTYPYQGELALELELIDIVNNII